MYFALGCSFLYDRVETAHVKHAGLDLGVGENPEDVIQKHLQSGRHQGTVVESLLDRNTDLRDKIRQVYEGRTCRI